MARIIVSSRSALPHSNGAVKSEELPPKAGSSSRDDCCAACRQSLPPRQTRITARFAHTPPERRDLIHPTPFPRSLQLMPRHRPAQPRIGLSRLHQDGSRTRMRVAHQELSIRQALHDALQLLGGQLLHIL